MTRAFALISTVLCASVAAGFVSPALIQKDYTTLPPTPAEVESKLAAGKIGLTQAIEIAAKEGGGSAVRAEMHLGGATPSIEVIVYGGGKAQRLMIDGASGAVTNRMELPALPGDAVSSPAIETASGLKYYELKAGTGPKPDGPQTQVKVHYTGWLVDGVKFDSSVDRGQPATFALSNVIAGWTEGVGSMQVGGKRKLIIPYKLAYGERGRAPTIPAKATLIFDVELLEIVR
jgi:hypothetical protein